VLALLLCLAAAPANPAESYGLVIGIDDYIGTENDLEGAVNDAQDVAHSLNEAGAKEVVRLLNDDASKDKIVAAWEGLVNKAKAGDTIVFSYAGHGGQEPAPPDRHDKTHIESFLLGHFEPNGPGTSERIGVTPSPPAISGPPTTSRATSRRRACSSIRSAQMARTPSSMMAARPSSACRMAFRPIS
jgi:hypothetical protein